MSQNGGAYQISTDNVAEGNLPVSLLDKNLFSIEGKSTLVLRRRIRRRKASHRQDCGVTQQVLLPLSTGAQKSIFKKNIVGLD